MNLSKFKKLVKEADYVILNEIVCEVDKKPLLPDVQDYYALQLSTPNDPTLPPAIWITKDDIRRAVLKTPTVLQLPTGDRIQLCKLTLMELT